MVEVIDFKDLMKEERFVPVANQDASDGQNKPLTKSLIGVIVLCVIATPLLYLFIRFGGGASDEGALKYNGIIQEIFSDIKNQYPSLKSATCTEGNAMRKDCVLFTFVFYPHDVPEDLGTAMSPVDKAFGVSDTDLVSLKATMKQMVEVKRQYIYGRRTPLKVLILSTNISRGGLTEETKMECVEKGNDIECGVVR